jgi:hypothetical protein
VPWKALKDIDYNRGGAVYWDNMKQDLQKLFKIPTRRRDVEIPDRKLSDQLWVSQSVQKKRCYVFLRPNRSKNKGLTFIFASTFNAFLFSQKCVLPGFILKLISLFAVASQEQAPLHCLKQTAWRVTAWGVYSQQFSSLSGSSTVFKLTTLIERRVFQHEFFQVFNIQILCGLVQNDPSDCWL